MFLAHVGYDEAVDITAALNGGIFNHPLSVRIWRLGAEEMPNDEEGKIQCILNTWKAMDDWIFEEKEAKKKDLKEYERSLEEAASTSKLYLK